jgi:ferredoxin-nitrite reductase
VNRIEKIKAEKGGLEVGCDLPRYAALGWEGIEEGDLERFKWWGLFFRKHTPGHFMMRIRIPNGLADAAQIRAIAHIAKRAGRGLVDITTRQQLQLRWIRIGDVPALLDELRAVGLVTLQTGMDNIRNVMSCPVAGLTPTELLDAAPIARAFTDTFVGNAEYTNLPRKFNVTITGCRENCTHAETQDLALVPATRDGGIVGFNVLVGGKNGSGGYRIATPLDVFVQPDDAVELACAVALLFRDHGARDARNRIRLAFLIDEWGVAKFRDALEGRLGRPLDAAGVDARIAKATDHVGVFRQKTAGLSYVGLLVPVGRMSGDQLVEVARLSEAYGTGEVRFTPDQNLIVPNVPDAKLGKLTGEPLLKVLRYDPSEIMRGLVSCTGIEFCNLAVIETKSRALHLARALEAKVHHGKPVRIHWSGCPAGCGNHTVADIGLLGTKAKVDGKTVDAVDVFIGGSSGPQPTTGIKILDSVPCETLPDVLDGLARYLEVDKVRKQLRAPVPAPPTGPAPTRASIVARPALFLDDLAEGAGTVVALASQPGAEAAVFRHDGCLYAIQNRCPHEGAALGGGTLDGDEVVCPLHGYRFNIKTGACSTDPTLRAQSFRVVARDGRFVVDA